MKKPVIKNFREVLFCEKFREECSKIKVKEKGCGDCKTCRHSEEIIQHF